MTDAILVPEHAPSPAERLLAWRRAWLTIDRNEQAVGFAASHAGLVVIHLAFFLLMALCGMRLGGFLLAAGALSLIAISPRHKLPILGLASIGYLFLAPFGGEAVKDLPAALMERFAIEGISAKTIGLGAGLGFFVTAFVALNLQARYRDTAPARRPLVTLLVVFWALVAVAAANILPPWPQTLLWSFIAMFAVCFWYLAYAMADQKSKDPTPSALRIGIFRPIWGAPLTPVGKGVAYLRKFEAQNGHALAAVRLRALKLMLWTAILYWTEHLLAYFFHDLAGIPTLGEALTAQTAGNAPELATGWAVIVAEYFLNVIRLCIFGHMVVAIVRMAGFGIPRNSVRPLAARSLSEFWNRYFFYFKELLVDFFFYPAFLRWFKSNRKLRLAFATFCAAGLGNFLFHFMKRIDLVALEGFMGAIRESASFALYCTALVTGLVISQLRNRKPQPQDGFLRYEVLPRINVGLFFCLLAIFGEITVPGTFEDRVSFFLSLFGVKAS